MTNLVQIRPRGGCCEHIHGRNITYIIIYNTNINILILFIYLLTYSLFSETPLGYSCIRLLDMGGSKDADCRTGYMLSRPRPTACINRNQILHIVIKYSVSKWVVQYASKKYMIHDGCHLED